MQKILLLILLTVVIYSCQSKKGFTITGELSNANGEKIYLLQRGRGLGSGTKEVILDSTIIQNNIFNFSGKIEFPNYYSVFIKDRKGWKTFILDNVDLSISGDANSIWKAEALGYEDNYLADSLDIVLTSYRRKKQKLYSQKNDAKRNKDTILVEELTMGIVKLDEVRQLTQTNFIKDNSASFESLHQLHSIYSKLEPIFTKELFESLDSKLRHHPIGEELQYYIFELDSIKTKPLDFSQADSDGVQIDIKSFRGQFVLVDFWASWCGPCRATHPSLKRIYDKYNERGFEIVSISLDNDRQRWLNAIKKDEVDWIHLSDLEGWNNLVAKKYNISSVPSNFLLNEDGVIIGTNLHSEELKDILGKKIK